MYYALITDVHICLVFTDHSFGIARYCKFILQLCARLTSCAVSKISGRTKGQNLGLVCIWQYVSLFNHNQAVISRCLHISTAVLSLLKLMF